MIPSYKDRSPDTILSQINYYDSSGRVFKALSWLDYAKRKNNISALEYAALETRLGIEQLLFEQLVVGVGSELDQREYKRCKGNAKLLDQIINRLIPKYEKLLEFTVALAPKGLPIARWNNKKLIEYSGRASRYLHWSGGLNVTVQSERWFRSGIQSLEEMLGYIWGVKNTGNTAVMRIDDLQPEIRELWDKYSAGEISVEIAAKRADILEPVLKTRLTRGSKGHPHDHKR